MTSSTDAVLFFWHFRAILFCSPLSGPNSDAFVHRCQEDENLNCQNKSFVLEQILTVSIIAFPLIVNTILRTGDDDDKYEWRWWVNISFLITDLSQNESSHEG